MERRSVWKHTGYIWGSPRIALAMFFYVQTHKKTAGFNPPSESLLHYSAFGSQQGLCPSWSGSWQGMLPSQNDS
jgi:hypothetical protein